ncbi:hypothetical protein E2C01_031683 [Portunus trituberculatus]|uniref:Uncharacterized protein n=1 Tax=Portunus trituberculatus TaxID=210409 RepID=A0A5B7ETE5_PORTR|nr:hypothetical protein [Portunus trituberculatus]
MRSWGCLWLVDNPVVSASSHLLVQMEKVCGSMADIASWTDQLLATWAGAASSMGMFWNFSRHLPRLIRTFFVLLRSFIADSLCYGDRREKHQLLSSPFSDVLFDQAVVARVQEDEHLASQQHALFCSEGVGLFFSGFSLCILGEKNKRADKEGCISWCLFIGSGPQALHYRRIVSGQGFSQWRIPWPGPGTQPKEAVTGHGAGFIEGSSFSIARKGQLVSVNGTKFSRGQSPYSVSMEVIPGSSGFPGEAGPTRSGMFSVPSVVPEETLEGSTGPTLVAGFLLPSYV